MDSANKFYQRRTEKKCLVLLEKIVNHLQELEVLKNPETLTKDERFIIKEKVKRTKALIRMDEKQLFHLIRDFKKKPLL